MANSILTINMITRRAVQLFKNSNAFIKNINTQYDDDFAIDGAKIGDTLRIRLPNDYAVSDGPGLSIQDTVEQSTSLTISSYKSVHVAFNTKDRTLSMDDYEERVLAPMLNNLAGQVAANVMSGVEGGACNMVRNVDGSNNIIAPSSGTILDANATLTDNSAGGASSRQLVASPKTMARSVDALKGLFNPQPAIGKQYFSGQIYNALNFKWYEDPTVLNHTTGTYNSAGTVNGAGQTGTTLVVNAITGTLKKGDMITIAAVNGVNRVTKQSWGYVRQFVVTADVANGATSIPIYPAIIPGGAGYVPATGAGMQQYQTVDASPANGAVISLVNKASEVYRKNIAFVPNAITMGSADLVMPKRGVEEASRENYDGVSMRMLTGYLFNTDQLVTRLDVIFGWLFIRPEWVCIVPDAV